MNASVVTFHFCLSLITADSRSEFKRLKIRITGNKKVICFLTLSLPHSLFSFSFFLMSEYTAICNCTYPPKDASPPTTELGIPPLFSVDNQHKTVKKHLHRKELMLNSITYYLQTRNKDEWEATGVLTKDNNPYAKPSDIDIPYMKKQLCLRRKHSK